MISVTGGLRVGRRSKVIDINGLNTECLALMGAA
jgi:hypothetical protein